MNSSYELIDVVDKDDKVVGQVERTSAWDKNRDTVYRAVNIIVRRSDGRFVFALRKSSKGYCPRRFGAGVGSLVRSGQDYADAARIGLQDELGIEVPLREVGKLWIEDPVSAPFFLMVYDVVYDGEFSNWEAEAEHLEEMTLEEFFSAAERYPYWFTPALLQILPRYKA